MEIAALLKKAYKVCSDNMSMCTFQKMMADQLRYAYDALAVKSATQTEGEEDIINMIIDKKKLDAILEEREAIRDKALATYSLGANKAERGILSANP